MSVKFNFDISMDELNLPPLENYADAKFFANKVKIGNFIKKYWGRLKLDITDAGNNYACKELVELAN
jgi:hypothetical protein